MDKNETSFVGFAGSMAAGFLIGELLYEIFRALFGKKKQK